MNDKNFIKEAGLCLTKGIFPEQFQEICTLGVGSGFISSDDLSIWILYYVYLASQHILKQVDEVMNYATEIWIHIRNAYSVC